eukprot:scaffold37695_cov37-Phaeocystis_antarctica.AAC.1
MYSAGAASAPVTLTLTLTPNPKQVPPARRGMAFGLLTLSASIGAIAGARHEYEYIHALVYCGQLHILVLLSWMLSGRV